MKYLIPALFLTVSAQAAEPHSHIKHAVCSEFDRAEAISVVGQPVTVTLPKGEDIYDATQTRHLGGLGDNSGWSTNKGSTEHPIGNNPTYWAVRPNTAYLTITTVDHDGEQHFCALKLIGREAPTDESAEPAADLTFNLVLHRGSAPSAQPSRPVVAVNLPGSQPSPTAVKAWLARKREAEDKGKEDALLAGFNRDTCHYHAHGKTPNAIHVRCPMDNGVWTIFRLPGLTQKPAAYIVANPENRDEDRLAMQHQSGEFLVVEEIAPLINLQLGTATLDIVNDAYDPAGRPTATGTVDGAMRRELIQAR